MVVTSVVSGASEDNTNNKSRPRNIPPPPLPPPPAVDGSESYDQLGIFTGGPKRLEYATTESRRRTYEEWPKDHHMSVDDLVRCFFYYAGYADCTRCFYCGGGLIDWELDDHPMVEHARWFPKCGMLRFKMGQNFVNAVQALHAVRDTITMKDVEDTLAEWKMSSSPLLPEESSIEHDPSVRAVVSASGPGHKGCVTKIAIKVKSEGGTLSAASLMDALDNDPESTVNVAHRQERKTSQEVIEMRREMNCKICQEEPVSAVFLPCGHLVTCKKCLFFVDTCPVCRETIRGRVKACFGSYKKKEEEE